MAIEALEGVTDRELFDDANADETTEEAVVEAPAAEEEQPHVETAEVPAEVPETVVTAEKPAVDDSAPQVPSWRVREINEERRAAIAERDALLAEKANWQRQPAPQVPQPTAQAQTPVRPDPLLDPDGYAAAIRQELRDEALNDRREESLQRASDTNPEEFKEAYAEAQKVVDPALKARMQTSRDPGKTLLQWNRERKTRAEVGDDPNAFFEKRLDAWLADPTNQAKVIERARGGAQQQPGGKPAPVNLPPSLTRTAAAATIDADDDDISDDGLWRHANA